MDSLNDLYSRDERMATMVPPCRLHDPLELAGKRILTDAWPIALMLAIVMFLGFAMGYQAGFRDGAEKASTTQTPQSERQNR